MDTSCNCGKTFPSENRSIIMPEMCALEISNWLHEQRAKDLSFDINVLCVCLFRMWINYQLSSQPKKKKKEQQKDVDDTITLKSNEI